MREDSAPTSVNLLGLLFSVFVLTLNLRKNTGESYGLKEDDR